jgi:hypothetical protein
MDTHILQTGTPTNDFARFALHGAVVLRRGRKMGVHDCTGGKDGCP